VSTRGILDPASGLARFRLGRRPPAPDLAAVVDFHWMVEWDLRGEAPHVQSVLPFPCVNLAADDYGLRVYGPTTRRFDRELSARGWAVGTRFGAGLFAGFGGVPLADLTDAARPAGDVFGASGAALAADVAEASPEDHIAAVERFLRARRPPPDPRADLAARVVEEMLRHPAGATVAGLAAATGVSPRTLQRLFRTHVGLTPKQVLQRSRLHEALERLDAGAGTGDGAALALDLGYSDQAHFINDFRALAGSSPARYAAS
jgi:AraC-like DNA-binding protein